MSNELATKGDLERLGEKLEREIQELESRLLREIGAALSHVTNVVLEQIRDMIAALDEKYRDLPRQVASLRGDRDDHVSDPALHHSHAGNPSR